MRIIQLIYSLSSGGAERFVVDLSNRLAEMGHEVHLCMLLDDSSPHSLFYRKFLADNVRFHSLGFDKGFSVAKCVAVERFIRSAAPDVVHCHLNVIPYVFGTAMFSTRIRFVHTLHSVAEHCAGLNIQIPLNRYFYSRGIIRPVVISNECGASYTALYGQANAACIENGRSDVCGSESYEEAAAEVESYKRDANTPVFIHVARFCPAKNQRLLVEAFNELDRENIDFSLLVIGSCYDSPEGLELQSDACEKIRFLGVKSNVGDYMLCSDAFCLTSVYEGLPISLLEALSCGLTPVCTPAGGIPDVIADGVTGYLSSGQTKESYAAALKRYIDVPIEPEVLKNLFAQKYSIEICAEKYLKQYEL